MTIPPEVIEEFSKIKKKIQTKIFGLKYHLSKNKIDTKKVIMRISILLVMIGSLVGGCSYINKKLGLADDNIFEEAIENKIEDVTGLDLDLTPGSLEK